MKALVVDPDRTARSVVKRLLSHVNVEVIEADNGLVALNALEQADPDFVVIEVDMPILNGYDCLAAIRQSPVCPDIPVICITSTGTREAVTRMIGLGVTDFLLKPIHPVDVLPRIKNLLIRVAQWRQRRASPSIASLLIVDHDPNFLAFAKPLLENNFEVLEAASSTAAAICFRDASPPPAVVCLAEGMPLMNEDLLVDVIRKMALESGVPAPRFFLLSSSSEVPADKAGRYAGIVKKAFVPQAFVDEFRRVVIAEQSPYERLRHLVHEGLRAEIVTATQQTIGVMIGSEIAELLPEDTTEVPTGVVAEITLSHRESGVSLRTLLLSGRREVETMGSVIVRREITFEQGANDVLGELVNTIAGRMRASLISRGFDLKLGMPEVRTLGEGESAPNGMEMEAKFRCTSGEVFRVGLQIIASEGGSLDMPTMAEASIGVVTAGAPGPDGVEAAADDVLF